MWEDKENSDDEEADFVRYGHIDDDIGKPVAGSFCRTHSLDNIFYTYSVDDTGDTTYMIEMNNYGTVIQCAKKDDKFSGQAVITYKDGRVYQGNVIDKNYAGPRPNGYGKWYSADKTIVKQGWWKIQGKYYFTFEDGTIINEDG